MSKRKAKTAIEETPSFSDDDSSSDDEEDSEIFEEEDEEDDSELEEVGGFEDVDVAELCTLSTGDQQKIIEKVHQRETERYNHEFATLKGKGPEAFSELSVRSFLNKARFDNKLESCRSRVGQQYGDSGVAHRDKARRIATNADRRFIFEKEVVRSSHTLPAEKGSEQNKSSLGPCVGRMLPGESIVDGCQRLKRERKEAAAKPAKNEDEFSGIEWEDPITFSSIQSSKQKTS